MEQEAVAPVAESASSSTGAEEQPSDQSASPAAVTDWKTGLSEEQRTQARLEALRDTDLDTYIRSNPHAQTALGARLQAHTMRELTRRERSAVKAARDQARSEINARVHDAVSRDDPDASHEALKALLQVQREDEHQYLSDADQHSFRQAVEFFSNTPEAVRKKLGAKRYADATTGIQAAAMVYRDIAELLMTELHSTEKRLTPQLRDALRKELLAESEGGEPGPDTSVVNGTNGRNFRYTPGSISSMSREEFDRRLNSGGFNALAEASANGRRQIVRR